MKKNTKFFYILIIAIACVGIFFDMLTKHLATNASSEFLSGVLSFKYVLNSGAGWSILSEHPLILTILTGALIAMFVFFLIKFKPTSLLFSIAFGLILGGAIGNFIDRVFIGAVRDFLCLEFISFPIFNIADCLLTVGAILLCVWIIFFQSKGGEKNEK